jgi:hypothetical protein
MELECGNVEGTGCGGCGGCGPKAQAQAQRQGGTKGTGVVMDRGRWLVWGVGSAATEDQPLSSQWRAIWW